MANDTTYLDFIEPLLSKTSHCTNQFFNLFQQLKNLIITLPFAVPESHCIERHLTRTPTEHEREQLAGLGVQLETKRFNPEEDAIIRRNWERFSKEYMFDDPAPFMSLHVKGTPCMPASERRHLIQFLGHGLPNRTLYSIYGRFRTLYRGCIKGTSLTSCGILSLLEPPGISRADGKRPDGLTLIPWSRGKSLIWDSTCVDTLAPSHLPNTSRHAASAAELAVKKKIRAQIAIVADASFLNPTTTPFAVETFGPWRHDAKVLVSQISQILISITGDRRCTTYLRQRLSIAIQRGNAMSVLGTLPESSPLDELFLL
ncbi:hypothetical protein ANN_21883 [Periplaneta americana]|uniref:Uncharacterized protein n=1 Tax=Periplaneta americana TaxID=6978 RepID=A0ABQ8S7L7_PERAM|nr:hypothetical protein ANN_21883 [Periplaneta americana]